MASVLGPEQHTPSIMRGHRSGDLTHPDAACADRSQPTQESSQPGSPAEDNTARRSAQPWLQMAKRSDRQQQNTSSSSAAVQSGYRTSAQGHRRKRGCRGHGAQQKRAQQRSQQAAVSQDQRAARRRSDPISLESIAAAVRAQCEAVTAMTAVVQQLAKQVSNFLFAQRQPHQQRQPQRKDVNVGKTAELNKKGEGEWVRIEELARSKLAEVRAERERQMEDRILELQKTYHQPGQTIHSTARVDWEKQIHEEFVEIEDEIQKAVQQEREYERCDYRRTHCKALNELIVRHNSCKLQIRDHADHYREINEGNSLSFRGRPEYDSLLEEKYNCVKYTFDQYGSVLTEAKFLVDPDRFWSYDLLRSKAYGERPL